MSAQTGRLLDRLGMAASAVCAVHCVLTGFALGLLSVAGFGFLGNPIVDIGFLATAALVGGFAVWHGLKRHKNWIPAAVFVLGLSAIVFGHFVLADHGHSGAVHEHGPLPSVFSAIGGLCLVGFHILNLRLRPHCDCKGCHQGHIGEHEAMG